MSKRSRFYPRVQVDSTDSAAVGQAGGVLLTDAVGLCGLDRGLSAGLAPWRAVTAVHDPGTVVLDLALTLALGGDCLADVALLRAEPAVYGLVASDPTVSRTISALAADAPAVLKALESARAAARARVWSLAGEHAPDHGTDATRPLVVDLDATLVTSHSDKEQAAPTFKRGFGFNSLCSFVDHGPSGAGEPLAVALRPGNAGSDTAADHIAVTRAALAQLPGHRPGTRPGHRPGTRPGRRVLVRTDGAGCSHDFLDWVTGQRLSYSVDSRTRSTLVPGRLSYSVGFTLPATTAALLTAIPEHVWAPAYDAEGALRQGAWVAELTDLLDLTGWPPGTRVIARKERPHPGAQLRTTDEAGGADGVDGPQVTAFATTPPPADPAPSWPTWSCGTPAKDRIRVAKDTGLTNLPLQSFTANQIWCAIVALAVETTAWMQMLA